MDYEDSHFDPKVLRLHSLRRTTDDLDDAMLHNTFISPLMRDSHWVGTRWTSTKNPSRHMEYQNRHHQSSLPHSNQDIRGQSEPRMQRPVPIHSSTSTSEFSISKFSQRRMAMNRFLRPTDRPIKTTSAPTFERIAANVHQRKPSNDSNVSHFERIRRMSSDLVNSRVRWSQPSEPSRGGAEYGVNDYSKRRNLAEIKSKLNMVRNLNRESRDHIVDMNSISNEIEMERKQAELQQIAAHSAVRSHAYHANITHRRRHHYVHRPSRTSHSPTPMTQRQSPELNQSIQLSEDEVDIGSRSSPINTSFPYGEDEADESRQRTSPSSHHYYSPTVSSGDLPTDVAKALETAAEARAALEREVVERAMSEASANEKLAQESRTSAMLRAEVIKLQQSNQRAEQERKEQREEIRELRKSMNDLRASLSEFVPSEVAELRATVSSLRASMMDLQGDTRSSSKLSVQENAVSVWRYLQDFMASQLQEAGGAREGEEVLLQQLETRCEDGRVDAKSLRGLLHDAGAVETVSNSVLMEVIRMGQSTEDDDDDESRSYLHWSEFINKLQFPSPVRELRVNTPPLSNINLVTHSPDEFIDDKLNSTQNKVEKEQGEESKLFFRALFPPGPIGLSFMNLDDGEECGGIVVTNSDGAAFAAGVQIGDVIIEVNEEMLDVNFTEDNLFDLFMELPRPISIGFRRNSSTLNPQKLIEEKNGQNETEYNEEDRAYRESEKLFRGIVYEQDLDQELLEEDEELENDDDEEEENSSNQIANSKHEVFSGVAPAKKTNPLSWKKEAVSVPVKNSVAFNAQERRLSSNEQPMNKDQEDCEHLTELLAHSDDETEQEKVGQRVEASTIESDDVEEYGGLESDDDVDANECVEFSPLVHDVDENFNFSELISGNEDDEDLRNREGVKGEEALSNDVTGEQGGDSDSESVASEVSSLDSLGPDSPTGRAWAKVAILANDNMSSPLDLFRKFDLDGNGQVDLKELEAGFRKAGVFGVDEELTLACAKDQSNTPHLIQYHEFLAAIKEHSPATSETKSRKKKSKKNKKKKSKK